MGRKYRKIGYFLPIILLYSFIIVGGLSKVFQESLGYIPGLNMTSVSLDYYRDVLLGQGFLRDLLFSLYIAIVAATLSAIIGTYCAYRLVRSRLTWVKTLISKIMQMGIILPYLYMIFVVTLLFGKTGIYSRVLFHLGLISKLQAFPTLIYEPFGIGILLVFVFKGVPFVTLFVLNIMSNINDTYEGVASNLGASSYGILRRIYLPLCSNTIVWSIMILLAFDIGAFEVPYLLGSLDPQTLSIRLFSAYMDPNIANAPVTMTLAILLFIIGILAAVLYGRLVKYYLNHPNIFPDIRRLKVMEGFSRLRHTRTRPSTSKFSKLFGHTLSVLLVICLVLTSLLPLLYTLLLSINRFFRYPVLFPTKLTPHYWMHLLFHNPLLIRGLTSSLLIGLFTALLATFMGFLTGRGIARHFPHKAHTLMLGVSMPLFIPGMSLILGAHQIILHTPMANHWSGVVLIHLLFTLPYTTNIALSYFSGIPVEYEEVARSLGTNTFNLYRKVLLPQLLPGITLSMSIAFLISNTEYFSTFIIGGGRTITLSVLMYPYIANSDYGMGSTVGIVFVSLHLLAFILFNRLLNRRNYKPTLYSAQ